MEIIETEVASIKIEDLENGEILFDVLREDEDGNLRIVCQNLTHDQAIEIGRTLIEATGAEVTEDAVEEPEVAPRDELVNHLTQWLANVALKVDANARAIGTVDGRVDTTRQVLSGVLDSVTDRLDEVEEMQGAIGNDIETLWQKVDPYDRNQDAETEEFPPSLGDLTVGDRVQYYDEDSFGTVVDFDGPVFARVGVDWDNVGRVCYAPAQLRIVEDELPTRDLFSLLFG